MSVNKTDPEVEKIRKKLDQSRTSLLDLTRRNPLLKFKEEARFNIKIKLEGQGIHKVLPSLLQREYLEIGRGGEKNEVVNGINYLKIANPILLNEMQKKQVEYGRETGLNAVFLSIGFLKRTEANHSEETIKSPLLLMPIKIEDSAGGYRLNCLDSGVQTNISLIEYLKNNNHAPIAHELNHYNFENDDSILDYFENIRERIGTGGDHYKGWGVEQDEITISFFNLNSFLLYEDLNPENWCQNSNIKGSAAGKLINGKLEDCRESIEEHDFNSENICYVLPIDKSQAEVLYQVNQGKNIVVKGPPGTGKSQTIVNIISSAVEKGKTVLFVTEKAAALKVVKERLVKCGLEEMMLELHSDNNSNKSFYKNLENTLKNAREREQEDISNKKRESIKIKQELKKLTEDLNSYHDSMSTVIEGTDLAPNDVLGKIFEFRKTIDEADLNKIDIDIHINEEKFLNLEEVLKKYCRLVDEQGKVPQENPFYECLIQTMEGNMDFTLFHEELKRFSGALNDYERIYQHYEKIGMPALDDFSVESMDILLRSIEFLNGHEKKDNFYYSISVWIGEKEKIKKFIKNGRETITRVEELNQKLQSPYEWRRTSIKDLEKIKQNIDKHKSDWKRFFYSDYRKSMRRMGGLCKDKKTADEYAGILAQAIMLHFALNKMDEEYNSISPIIMADHKWENKSCHWEKTRRTLDEMDFFLDNMISIQKKILQKEIIGQVVDILNRDDFNKSYPGGNNIIDDLVKLEDYRDHFLKSFGAIQEKLRPSPGREKSKKIVMAQYPFSRLKEFFQKWAEASYGDLCFIAEYNKIRKRLSDEGLDSFLQFIDNSTNAMTSKDVITYFRAKWYNNIFKKATFKFGKIIEFKSMDQESKINMLNENIRLEMESNKNLVLASHMENIHDYENSSKKELLRIFHARRKRSVRYAFKNCGEEIQKIKPVIMMSPLSISNYIPPDSIKFDLVVFDEASQISPVNAYGALLRAKQSVVIGDEKQLPPTNFFQNIVESDLDEDEQEMEPTEFESILDYCLSQGCGNKMLKWHYRSKDPSLIYVSNIEFYDGSLVLCPRSSHGDDTEWGLRFTFNSGIYKPDGTKRNNPGEAKMIVEKISNHAKKYPKKSLGVVTFNKDQKEEIERQLEILRKEDFSLDHFSKDSDKFFVKNLETVQGDERDVILVSVGYGKEPDGRLHTRSFGPLLRRGGERRLNVVMTRAREKCEIFANFKHFDLRSEKSRFNGLQVLQQFLNYAENRTMIYQGQPISRKAKCESPFEKSVYEELEKGGYYRIHPQYRELGYFIDLAVENPDHPRQFLCGIECDGATYHSSAWARDRDAVRQLHLEMQGWKIYRIWSTDWFNSKEREVKKLLEYLKKRRYDV